MTLRNAAVVAAILLVVILAVGLILCRPMAAENYASGVFNLAAVSDITVRAWVEDPEAPGAGQLTLTPEDAAFDQIVEAFTRRGFGRTPGSIFSSEPRFPKEGDACWRITLRCDISQSLLTAEYTGGCLRLIGDDAVTVTTQNKTQWAQELLDLILPLYPQPEEEPPLD